MKHAYIEDYTSSNKTHQAATRRTRGAETPRRYRHTEAQTNKRHIQEEVALGVEQPIGVMHTQELGVKEHIAATIRDSTN
jgi:hypothetical protein